MYLYPREKVDSLTEQTTLSKRKGIREETPIKSYELQRSNLGYHRAQTRNVERKHILQPPLSAGFEKL